MNNPPTPQEIDDRFKQLPADVQQAIEASRVGEKITEVGKKYGLHIDQLGGLEDTTFFVMLGFANPQEFAQDIAKATHTTPEVAEQIAQELNTSLFASIRQSMQQFTGQADARGSSSAMPPTSAPVSLSKEDEVLTKTMISSSKTIDLSAPAPAGAPEQKKYRTDPYREPIS